MIGIYKITSPTGRIYIGQSWDIEAREKDYRPGRCKNQKKINASITKHGWKSHKFEVMYTFPSDITQDILDEYEIFYYKQYKDSGHRMLNLKECGKGGGKHSESTKRLIGIKSKEKFKVEDDYRILQLDKNLNLINTWDFADHAGLDKRVNIYKCCESSKIKMCYNHFWIYKKNRRLITQIDTTKIVERTNQYGKYYKYQAAYA